MTDIAPLATPARTDPAALRKETRLREASEGFEALFLNQILKSGRAASFGDEVAGGSAMETTQSLLDAKLTETGAGRAGLGLADAIYRQFAGHLGVSGK
ncbi:rod-binding protein [Roseovarius aquimarinus]|uniref:Rod-binding protein n=1 Tax=Roseovarius aquimarinus TaxID=1229156 RepID=A0ABW7I605_9RHOB